MATARTLLINQNDLWQLWPMAVIKWRTPWKCRMAISIKIHTCIQAIQPSTLTIRNSLARPPHKIEWICKMLTTSMVIKTLVSASIIPQGLAIWLRVFSPSRREPIAHPTAHLQLQSKLSSNQVRVKVSRSAIQTFVQNFKFLNFWSLIFVTETTGTS